MVITPTTRARIAALLGRDPRGLEDVPVVTRSGEPVVIRVASLVEGKPFPTLFWLVDPVLCYRIDREEASGLVRELQQRVDADSALQAAMREDNLQHIRLRDSFIDDETRQQLDVLGFTGVLERKGIGGIGDFGRIRCLHTWYAAHLVVPNTVGTLLDERWGQGAAVESGRGTAGGEVV